MNIRQYRAACTKSRSLKCDRDVATVYGSAGRIDSINRVVTNVHIQVRLPAVEEDRILTDPPPYARIIIPCAEAHGEGTHFGATIESLPPKGDRQFWQQLSTHQALVEQNIERRTAARRSGV